MNGSAAVRAGCLASPLSYAGLGIGDEAGAVSWQRAPAREKSPDGDKAKRAPAKRKAAARGKKAAARRR